MNLLEQLKNITVVVADSGDVDSIKLLKPTDATTNPSLILQAAKLPQYQSLIEDAIAKSGNDIDNICDQLIVNFGCEILKHVPGRISSEVDARLSFDTEGSIAKGRKLISLYQNAGIDKSRVLIKLASTWQGIKAAEQLEKEGIACNLTLLFSLTQAIACAEANITLISPFVGRILDWYKKAEGRDFQGSEDPGVQSVTAIYDYYKQNGYKTVVMGASFRNTTEITELAGCDLLTISPVLLNELQATTGELSRKLSADKPSTTPPAKQAPLDLQTFSWQLNENAMATEKLSEGIRNFAKDQRILEDLVRSLIK
ncbi:transaldolase [Colwellia sp. E150_009]